MDRTDNIYHGHKVAATLTPEGWRYELFAPSGESLGPCDTLAEAIAEAKRRFKVAEKLKKDAGEDGDEG